MRRDTTNQPSTVNPTVASRPNAEKLFDLGASHSVEIIGYRNLPGHEPEPADLTGFRGIKRYDLHQRFASLGDDERLAPGRTIQQARQVSFGFMYVDDQHCALKTKLH